MPFTIYVFKEMIIRVISGVLEAKKKDNQGVSATSSLWKIDGLLGK